MLIGLNQTDRRLMPVIRKYGCLFLCFAESSPIFFEEDNGAIRLNFLWEMAVNKGYITGDLNNDGDCDDDGEAVIVDHNGLARLFCLSVRYDNTHHKADEEIPRDVELVFGQFWWKSGHFVILNKRKEVIYDSMGYSNTVKHGKLKSMRWYYAG